MKERPILFSTPMVQAIQQGNKTVTRRIIKVQPDNDCYFQMRLENGVLEIDYNQGDENPKIKCPYGKAGDILWVRETWENYQGGFNYKAGKFGLLGEKWKPSIHMPKAACRIKLEITSITVERLHDITEEDAIREGVMFSYPFNGDLQTRFYENYMQIKSLDPNECHKILTSAKDSFKSLWQSINSPESWDANPWVWRIEFKKL